MLPHFNSSQHEDLPLLVHYSFAAQRVGVGCCATQRARGGRPACKPMERRCSDKNLFCELVHIVCVQHPSSLTSLRRHRGTVGPCSCYCGAKLATETHTTGIAPSRPAAAMAVERADVIPGFTRLHVRLLSRAHADQGPRLFSERKMGSSAGSLQTNLCRSNYIISLFSHGVWQPQSLCMQTNHLTGHHWPVWGSGCC